MNVFVGSEHLISWKSTLYNDLSSALVLQPNDAAWSVGSFMLKQNHYFLKTFIFIVGDCLMLESFFCAQRSTAVQAHDNDKCKVSAKSSRFQLHFCYATCTAISGKITVTSLLLAFNAGKMTATNVVSVLQDCASHSLHQLSTFSFVVLFQHLQFHCVLIFVTERLH